MVSKKDDRPATKRDLKKLEEALLSALELAIAAMAALILSDEDDESQVKH